MRLILASLLLAAAAFSQEAAPQKPLRERLLERALQGDAEAQYDLAKNLETGRIGLRRDLVQAEHWYRKAAEQGNANEQCSLGFRYDNGSGVPKDYAEAVKWYRKSAEQGNATAQFNLGMSYRYGDGVPKDIVQAHAWLNIAGANGNEPAKKLLVIIEKEEMTDSQKEKAMDLAREMFARLEKK